MGIQKKNSGTWSRFGHVDMLTLSLEKEYLELRINTGKDNIWTSRCSNGVKELGTGTFKEISEFRFPTYHSLAHFFQNFRSRIGIFELKVSSETFSLFGEDTKLVFLKEIRKILKKRSGQLRVGVFKVNSEIFDEQDYLPILENLDGVETIAFLGNGNRTSKNIDLYKTSILPQWKNLKMLKSEWNMASSHWAHIPSVTLKLPDFNIETFDKLLEDLHQEHFKTNKLELLVDHIDLGERLLLGVLGTGDRSAARLHNNNYHEDLKWKWEKDQIIIEKVRESDTTKLAFA